MAKQQMSLDDLRKNVPGTVTKSMIDFMHARVPHYLFKHAVGNKRFAYCTNCKQDIDVSDRNMKHKKEYMCPACTHTCTAIDSGRGRKLLEDQSYFTFFKRANRRTDAICALGVFIRRQWDDDYRKVSEFAGELHSMYLFEHGKGSVRYSKRWTWNAIWKYDFHHVQEIGLPRQLFLEYPHIKTFCDVDSLKSSVKGTPFERYRWEQYDNDHFIRFLDAASKWPSIEYLDKLGYRTIIKDYCIHGAAHYGAIKWRGKTITGVLGVDKAAIKLAQKLGVDLDCGVLYVLQLAKRQGDKIDPLSASKIAMRYHLPLLKSLMP